MNKSKIRRWLLAGISILDCYFSAGYARDIYNGLPEMNFIEYPGEIIVDGSDFTPIADLAVTGMNGMFFFLTVGISVLISTVFILIFAILLRVTTIRKKDDITSSDLTFAKRCIAASSVLAFIGGILLSSIDLIPIVAALSWQQPLFMLLIYYRALKKQATKEKEKEQEISWQQSND